MSRVMTSDGPVWAYMASMGAMTGVESPHDARSIAIMPRQRRYRFFFSMGEGCYRDDHGRGTRAIRAFLGRATLAACLTAAMGGVLPAPAHASAPQVKTQAPGFSWRSGEGRCSARGP